MAQARTPQSIIHGIAAVDVYLGATALPDEDPRNKVYPGEFKYGGAHVIEELTAGKDARLSAITYGTDCYPRKKLDTYINIKDLNEAVLFNPRNCYQNYNIAVNLGKERAIYTYMGVLRPDMANANYCSAGQLSPLLNDPYYQGATDSEGNPFSAAFVLNLCRVGADIRMLMVLLRKSVLRAICRALASSFF